jgi:hypothetical protein
VPVRELDHVSTDGVVDPCAAGGSLQHERACGPAADPETPEVFHAEGGRSASEVERAVR